MFDVARIRPLRRRASDLLLAPLVLIAVLTEEVLWRGCLKLLACFGRFALVCALRGWLARLPPLAALPLFLVPETASQGGVAVSGWMAWQGHTRAAILVLILAKTLATLVAVWIYKACEPALLRVRWFARLHHRIGHWRDRALAWVRSWMAPLRARLFPARHAAGARLAARFRRLRRRFSFTAVPRNGRMGRPG